MKRRPIIIVSLIVLLVIVAISTVITHAFSANRYKEIIIHKIEQASGHRISINGDISWQLFPHVGVKIPNIIIDQNGKSALARLRALKVNIELLPLFKKHIVIDEISLVGLRFDLSYLKEHENSAKNKITNINNGDSAGSKSDDNNFNHSPKNYWFSLNLQALNLTDTVIMNYNKNGATTNAFDIVLRAPNEPISISKSAFTMPYIDFRFNDDLRGSFKFALTQQTESMVNYHGDIHSNNTSLIKASQDLAIDLPAILKSNSKIFNNISIDGNFSGTYIKTDTKSKNELSLDNLRILLNNGTIVDGKVAINTLNQNALATHRQLNLKADSQQKDVLQEDVSMNINNHLHINHLNLADFVDLHGFKLNASDINLDGYLSMHSKNNTHSTTGNQTIYAANVRLLGFDANNFVNDFNRLFNPHLPNSNELFAHPQALLHDINVPNSITQLQQSLSPLTSTQAKDLRQSTNLGQLTTQLLINDHGITNPLTKLQGPTLTATGNGSVTITNSANQTLSYKLNLQFKQIDHIVFHIDLDGPLNNVGVKMNWQDLIGQILKQKTTPLSPSHLSKDVQHGLQSIGNAVSTWSKKASELFK